MSTATRAEILADVGADILLELESAREFPLPDRPAVGKAIHETFMGDRLYDKLAVQFDIYRMKHISSPHYWSGGRLDRICASLEKRGRIFKYLRDFGWGFLTEQEFKEWREARAGVATTIVERSNEATDVANANWPDSPVPHLVLQQRQIEAPKP